MKYYIKDNYYFDIDHNNQFRITGPENHLLFGSTFFDGVTPEVVAYEIVDSQLRITLSVVGNSLRLSAPLVTDIRTLRSFTEAASPRPLYSELSDRRVLDVLPRTTEHQEDDAEQRVLIYNQYTSDDNAQKIYGATIIVPKPVRFTKQDSVWELSSDAPFTFSIQTFGNIQVIEPLAKKIFQQNTVILQDQYFTSFLKHLYAESEAHIEHLIHSKKTSSFEYGTIFPRDWIESADLGEGDLSSDAIDYMYTQSMHFVSEKGEGWHEDAIGEYRKKAAAPIDRKMIDIEPRYILGLKRVSKHFLTQERIQQKLRLVAQYIVEQATKNELISFKKIDQSDTEYHVVGNWRDSFYAFPKHKSPLSPYDVNCVFYPMSLKIIREYFHFFQVSTISELDTLIERWDKQKNAFRLYHPGGMIGYSLAVHGKKNIPLPIPHLDEAFDMFYGVPSLEEVISFSEKLLNPDYFYTPVGPQLVSTDEELFTTEQYHGQVIWPKQAAYAIAGLGKQLSRGRREGWAWPVLEQIQQSILMSCEACFRGWEQLGSVPELYYYDRHENRARFYTDQPHIEGQMSLIQLWSSVGCRRIIREYQKIKEDN